MADNIDGVPPNAAEIAVANAINNINGRNRIIGGGAPGVQVDMVNMRDRLFHAIYFRAAAAYAELVPSKVRLAIEMLLLLKAVVFFFTLVYVHIAFIKNPCTCLQEVQNWPREGVIRVEIIPNLSEKRAMWQRMKQDQQTIQGLKDSYYYGIGPQTYNNHYMLKRYEMIIHKLGLPIRPTFAYSNVTQYHYFDAVSILDTYDHPNTDTDDDDDEQYIVEYSLEYGHLRLSPTTRKRLKIPVLVVQLDPNSHKCFGDKLTRYLLKRLLGYDDLLMASIRTIAEQDENKGYLRNVVTGEHYRFVSMWWATWSSYPAAFFVMLLFTFSVSMLLRYSHHQIFVFIVDLLQMLEYNVSARFPIAPLLTVILALVGMEAIMSEFFNDTTTAFYIILIVWVADQFDAICCHTSITKRHWLRFFYLYHFAFYAYHYRFSGQYRTLALLSSYLFIQHSMVFFFHRYELPAIMAQAHVFVLTRNQNQNGVAGANGAAGGAAPAPAAGAGEQQQPAIQRARLIVRRMFQQIAAQRQAEEQAQEEENDGQQIGWPPLPNNARAVLAITLANMRRLPMVGYWLQRREQFATVRRVFLGHNGNGQMMHVHLQRINVADIPNLRNQTAAAANVQQLNSHPEEPAAAPAANADASSAAAPANRDGVTIEQPAAGVAQTLASAAMSAPTTTTSATHINDSATNSATEETTQTQEAKECVASLPEIQRDSSLENRNSTEADIMPMSGEITATAIKTADSETIAETTTAAAAAAPPPAESLTAVPKLAATQPQQTALQDGRARQLPNDLLQNKTIEMQQRAANYEMPTSSNLTAPVDCNLIEKKSQSTYAEKQTTNKVEPMPDAVTIPPRAAKPTTQLLAKLSTMMDDDVATVDALQDGSSAPMLDYKGSSSSSSGGNGNGNGDVHSDGMSERVTNRMEHGSTAAGQQTSNNASELTEQTSNQLAATATAPALTEIKLATSQD